MLQYKMEIVAKTSMEHPKKIEHCMPAVSVSLPRMLSVWCTGSECVVVPSPKPSTSPSSRHAHCWVCHCAFIDDWPHLAESRLQIYAFVCRYCESWQGSWSTDKSCQVEGIRSEAWAPVSYTKWRKGKKLSCKMEMCAAWLLQADDHSAERTSTSWMRLLDALRQIDAALAAKVERSASWQWHQQLDNGLFFIKL